MTSDFNPPIEDRNTSELLSIVGSEEKWNPIAVEMAYAELKNRNVDSKRIKHSKYISDKKDRIDVSRKETKGYDLIDFVGEPFWTTIEILFSFELKKDGFAKKARQQKRVRIGILTLIIVGFIYSEI